MLKNILNLKGVKSLNKNEQSNITGGYDWIPCNQCNQCAQNRYCNGTNCVPCQYNPNPQDPCCISPNPK